MWGLAQELIDGAVSVPLAATAAAVRLMAERNRVVAEGAGALALAAALAGHGGGGKVVCIVSGGNIDLTRLVAILQGETPADLRSLAGTIGTQGLIKRERSVQESVKVGDKFPVSELVASDGQRLDLESLAGPAVVYFYPATAPRPPGATPNWSRAIFSMPSPRLRPMPAFRGILIPGSISVVQQLLAAGLVDELRLLVHPVAALRAAGCFDHGDAPYHLKMTATRRSRRV